MSSIGNGNENEWGTELYTEVPTEQFTVGAYMYIQFTVGCFKCSVNYVTPCIIRVLCQMQNSLITKS